MVIRQVCRSKGCDERDLRGLGRRKIGGEEQCGGQVSTGSLPGAPAPPSPGALCQGGDPEGPSLPRLSASPRFAIGGVQFGVGLDPRRSHLFEAERRSGQMGLGINNGQADQGCKGDCEERCGEGNRLGVHGGFVCPAG